MNNVNNILDMFPEREMKDKLNDIIIAINELSKRHQLSDSITLFMFLVG
jgi:hypothetical protein